MKLVLLLVFVLPAYIFGQETFRDDYQLKGTTVLTGSDKNALSYYVHGYRLSGITSSDCQSNGRYEEIIEEVGNISRTDSSLIISASISGNCAHAFLGEIEIVNDSIVNLISHGYGGNSTCACCFGLIYTISIDDSSSKKVKYAMINGIRNSLIELD